MKIPYRKLLQLSLIKPDPMKKTSTQRVAAILPMRVECDALVGLKNRSLRFAAALASVFVVTSRLLAQFNYADFSNAENLSILNDATVLGRVMQLTPATGGQNGTVFHAFEQSLGNGFETTFSFQINDQGGVTDASGNPGGDGLAFIIQRQGADVSGPRVGYIPYSIPDCLAVEFDTWCNRNLDDPDGNHISLQPVGPSPDGYSEFFHSLSLGSTSSIPDMSDGNLHTARISYEPGVMRVYLDDLATPALTVPIDLRDVNGTSVLDAAGRAWVGLAAGTGAAYEAHDILSWSLTLAPGPLLSITRLGSSQVRISWPTSAPGYNLETATSLPASAWTTVTDSPAVVGDSFLLDLDSTAAAGFFRLRKL